MSGALPSTLGEALAAAAARIDRLDARLLVQHVSGCRRADLIARPETPLAAGCAERLATLVARRAAGEPLAYLTGTTGFRDHVFSVSPAVLIPRPETGVLVDLAVARARAFPAPRRLLDLGTGSGIVAICLALEVDAAEVSAVDLSPEALAVATANAARLGARVRFLAGDWYAPLAGARFHVIAANPPYVASGDPHLTRDGLPFEPQLALTDGVPGGDGLSCLRALVAGAAAHLEDGGWLLLEHGYDQGDAVRALLQAHGFADVATWPDLAGIDRVSGGCRRRA